MKVFLKVLAFVILIDLVYMGIGQTLTQVEIHPPAKQVITVDTYAEDLTSIGKVLVQEKGGCVLCHITAMLPESALVRGQNRLRVHRIVSQADAISLAPVRLAKRPPKQRIR